MFIVIIYFPVYDVINFEINFIKPSQSFFLKLFSCMNKTLDNSLNALKNWSK